MRTARGPGAPRRRRAWPGPGTGLAAALLAAPVVSELRAAGTSEADLLRAQELYAGLTAERLDDERLWAALFRVCGRLGDQLSLDLSERRLRTALVELGVGEDADTVPLPPSLERVLQEVRAALDGRPRTSAP